MTPDSNSHESLKTKKHKLTKLSLISVLIFNILILQNNITPLHVASRWGKNNMITLLLDNKAAIDEKTRVWKIHILACCFSRLRNSEGP